MTSKVSVKLARKLALNLRSVTLCGRLLQLRNECTPRLFSSTVDSSEVDFHSNFAQEWWNENGPMKALHSMNDLRVELVRTGLCNDGKIKEKETLCSDYLKGVSLLDVGCGGGILSIALARLGCSVIGIDPSTQLVQVAQSAANKFKLSDRATFLATSIEDYSKSNNKKHDGLICSEVIEHVSNKTDFITSCISTIKPGGSIFFTTPNKTVGSYLTNIFGAEFVLRLLPRGTHHYEKFISHNELKEILEKNNCTVKLVSGYFYNPMNNSWSWVPTTHFMYALHASVNP